MTHSVKTNTVEFEPAVYCGTYHKYNSGSLKGEWIKLADFDSIEDFYEYCKELHSDEDDPEYMFQDYEYGYGMIGESWIDAKLWEVLELDEYDQKKLFIYIEATGADIGEALERYEDMFFFPESETAYVIEELYPSLDMSKLPDFVTIDEDAFKRWYTEVRYNGETYLCDTNF